MADHMTAMTAEQLRTGLTKLWREMADFRCAGSEMTADAVHMYMQDYAEQLRVLAARLSGMAADTWQPIETAPKDGRLIWAFNTHDATRAPWQYECMWSGTEWYHGLGNSWPRRPPTHWRELPAAPEPPHV